MAASDPTGKTAPGPRSTEGTERGHSTDPEFPALGPDLSEQETELRSQPGLRAARQEFETLVLSFGGLLRGPDATRLSVAARSAHMEPEAAGLLEKALARALPVDRNEIRRRLARLCRRLGQFEKARAHLLEALEEDPADTRARRALVDVALEEGRREVALEHLEELEVQAVHAARFRVAARLALERGRLLHERMNLPEPAARAYTRAAEHARRAGNLPAVFSARTLAVRALVEANAPAAQIEGAVREFEAAGHASQREVAAVASRLRDRNGAGQAKALAALAETSQARGAFDEAAALLQAAVQADPADASLAVRLEGHFIARGRWRELAAHYRQRAERESKPQAKAELLLKLAELQEDELLDKDEAARTYARIAEITGDPAALASQVRLLSSRAGIREALDAAAAPSRPPALRLEALLLRGELGLAAGGARDARDFEAALALSPDNLRALAGLAECRLDVAAVERFERCFWQLPRGSANRLELARRLARLLEACPGLADRGRAVWRELLVENPLDEEAERRLIELARGAGDRRDLVNLLRRRLAREPRGAAARTARHELAGCLEQMGLADEALEEWRAATRMEPGDAVALLALADRCEKRGRPSEAAFALEGAAAATEKPPERAALWLRLARLLRERLGDSTQAAACEERARVLAATPAPSGPPGAASPEQPAAPSPAPAPLRPEERVLVGSELTTPVLERRPPGQPEELKTPVLERRPPGAMPEELKTAELDRPGRTPATPSSGTPARSPMLDDLGPIGIVPRKPLGPQVRDEIPTISALPEEIAAAADRPRTLVIPGRVRGARASGEQPSTPVPGPGPTRRNTQELPRLLARLEERPLEAESYRELAAAYEERGEADRVAVMKEIAAALEDQPLPEPSPPRFMLSESDWVDLCPAVLRGGMHELLVHAGGILCGLEAVTPKEAGVRRAFKPHDGRATRAVAAALEDSERVLGLRAVEVSVGDLASPPLWTANTDPPRVLVGTLAASRLLPQAQLRFFAGRALCALRPGLMPLRLLPEERLKVLLDLLKRHLRGDKPTTPQARELAKRIPTKLRSRLERSVGTTERRWAGLPKLVEAARHSSNRAGLIAAGGVSPAVAALRAKRGATAELEDLLRFAASDAYAALRARR